MCRIPVDRNPDQRRNSAAINLCNAGLNQSLPLRANQDRRADISYRCIFNIDSGHIACDYIDRTASRLAYSNINSMLDLLSLLQYCHNRLYLFRNHFRSAKKQSIFQFRIIFLQFITADDSLIFQFFVDHLESGQLKTNSLYTGTENTSFQPLSCKSLFLNIVFCKY